MTLPIVSCICPTANRPKFVAQARLYFDRQSYPHKELIVIDDPSLSVGAKRNKAIEEAQGELILLWDDDDWYGAHRISYQVGPLLAQEADMTGLSMDTVFDISKWKIWQSVRPGMFPGYILGGTLCFKRALWEQGIHYINKSDGEDSNFVHRAVIQGMRLQIMPMLMHYVYVRHPFVKKIFAPGEFFLSEAWKIQAPEQHTSIAREDLRFYREVTKNEHGR